MLCRAGRHPPIPHSQLRPEYAGTALRTHLPRLYLAGRSPGHPVRRPLPPLPGEATASLFTPGRVRGAGTRLHRPRLVVCEVTDGWRWERRKQIFKKRSLLLPGPPPLPVPCTPPPRGFPVALPGWSPFRGPAPACIRDAGALSRESCLLGAFIPSFPENFPNETPAVVGLTTRLQAVAHQCLEPQNCCLRPVSGEGKPELVSCL